MERTTPIAMLAVVVFLCMVHIPNDLRHRSLKRSHTLVAVIAVSVTAVTDSLVQGSIIRFGTALSAVLIVGGIYWLLHRASPNSLGFGDVLLALPLSFALAWSDALLVLTWQLAASCTGAIHAATMWFRKGIRTIAFAPHLLVTASVVLALNI